MGIKKFSPRSPGRRGMTGYDFSELTTYVPQRSLTVPLKRVAARNNHGQITIRHKGGGHKRKYRLIDFLRSKSGVPGTVKSIEYDPNRTARIALLSYVDGDKRYILAPAGMSVGDVVSSGAGADIKAGNSLELGSIPVGSLIHNVEVRPGKGAQLVRSAGTVATLVAKLGRYCQVRLPSGEVRQILSCCRATVGQVGNAEHENICFGKAGRRRWLGIRPTVRGMAMNPVDHPLGGGEGVGKGHHPVSPWGQPCKGYKTRNNKRTDSQIVKRRR